MVCGGLVVVVKGVVELAVTDVGVSDEELDDIICVTVVGLVVVGACEVVTGQRSTSRS